MSQSLGTRKTRSRNLFKHTGLGRQCSPTGKHLPPEFLNSPAEKISIDSNWEALLRTVIDQQLRNKEARIAEHIVERVESVLIAAALDYTQGKRHESALLLGYGRNTLTRKIKELELDVP